MNVTVVGLGKIGLPISVQIASKGHRVVGADIVAEVVDLVNRGEAPFSGEADLDTRLKECVEQGRLSATTDTAAAVAESETVVVVVPLVVGDDLQPDFSAMDAATADIARGLREGTLVSYETTLPVGTTRGRFAPALARGSGLTSGEEFFVCHSPERVFSGRILADLRRYPKLVGALEPEGAARAVAFYEAILDFDERPDLERPNGVWDLGSAEAAELAKLAETTYRNVNIGLANEFARYADRIGVDVYGVIDAANSQPFSHIHRPGVAVGGHCIPVYPRFYLAGDPGATVPEAAWRLNDAMPAYAVDRVADALGGLDGKRVALLGLAYRGGVKEAAFSGTPPLAALLRQRGAEPLVHDPLFSDDELEARAFTPFHPGDPCDAAVLVTDHAEYRALGPADLPGVRVFFDGRAWTDPADWPGVTHITLGRPSP
jgi:nucleotide sugar dehydrogenase